MNQNKGKNGSSDGGVLPKIAKLTKVQAEILGLFKSGRTASQIAAKRGCSHSYVARVLKKLHENNLVHAPVQGVGYTHEPHEPKSTPTSKELKRVHAQRFVFQIVRSTNGFKQNLSQTFNDGTYVQVSGTSLYVMAGKERCFSGVTLEAALRASMDWWAKRFSQMEFDLHCVFWKERKVFEVSYTEVASEGSSAARAVMSKEGHVRVFSSKDGKLRLSFDMSKGRPEHEVHHAMSWRPDDSAADHHFNAILDYGVEGATLPQLARLHADLVSVVVNQVKVTESIVRAVAPQEYVYGSDMSEADYFG